MVHIMDRAIQQQFSKLSNNLDHMLDRLEKLEQPILREREPPDHREWEQSTRRKQKGDRSNRRAQPIHTQTVQVQPLDQSCRESGGEQPNDFYIRCLVQGKVCLLNIDCGSCANIASDYMVEKLGLTTWNHPHPYEFQFNHCGKFQVEKQVLVSYSIGKYRDEVLCDVVPIPNCHILLGDPWQLSRRVRYDGNLNRYKIKHQDKTFNLVSMEPLEVLTDQIQMAEKRKVWKAEKRKGEREEELRNKVEKEEELEKSQVEKEIAYEEQPEGTISVELEQPKETLLKEQDMLVEKELVVDVLKVVEELGDKIPKDSDLTECEEGFLREFDNRRNGVEIISVIPQQIHLAHSVQSEDENSREKTKEESEIEIDSRDKKMGVDKNRWVKVSLSEEEKKFGSCEDTQRVMMEKRMLAAELNTQRIVTENIGRNNAHDEHFKEVKSDIRQIKESIEASDKRLNLSEIQAG